MKPNGIKTAVIALAILALSLTANAQWLSLTQAGPAQKTVSLVQSSNSQVVFEINVPGLEKSQVKTKGGDFCLLTIPGYGCNTGIGQPKLPVISEWLEIPQGATATAEFQILESREVSLKELGLDQKIVPVQHPVPKIAGAADKIPFVIDDDIYSKDEYFGLPKVVLSQPVTMRAKRAALVSFWPVSYNPVSGMLKIATRVKVTINLSGSDQARTNSVRQKYTSKLYDRHTAGIAINALTIDKVSKVVPPAPVNELVIVVDSLYSGIQSLADWDTRKGYYVTVTRTSEIPGGVDTASIRQYILAQYNGTNPPDLVLLVGDINGIPAHRSTEMDQPYTDLYYSTMAGSDIVPDLYVSRISVDNTTQLGYYVAKYLNYQRGAWGATQDWMQKAYFTASDDNTNPPLYHSLAESTSGYCMALSRAHGMTCDSLYAYYGTGTPVATAFNDGRTVMAYTGHGNITLWGGPAFSQADVNALTNAYKSTFVTSFACLTGDFNYSECFGETWIRAAGKGAIAFWGSSVNSYWDEDDILQRRLFDAFLDSGYALIGGMTVKAKLDFGRFYNWNSGPSVTVTRYFEEYNILGNAGVDMYTQQPLTVTVTHPDTVPAGPSQITVTVDTGGPLKDALVAIYQPSSKILLASGYTDVSGNAILDINPGIPDSLAITVTAHNCSPYQGRIQAYSSQAYMGYLKSLVDDAAGNGDGMFNPGESAPLVVWLKNYGLLATNGSLACTLRTNSPIITLNDSTCSLPSVAPGDSVSRSFNLTVAAACTNKTELPFTLVARDADSVWLIPFKLSAGAPQLIHDSYYFLDTASNIRGSILPGQSESLKVVLLNKGRQTAINTMALLSSSDSYITVTGNSASYGDLTPDSSSPSQPAYYIMAGTPPAIPYYAWVRLDITALGGIYSTADSFQVAIGQTGFYDDVESLSVISKYTAESQWHVTDTSFYSPGHSWWCGDSASGQYGNSL
ncbi:hypothetical protein HY768_07330, partial [candidate division TA06 bacterium]|nr:hypothetical protein [candidate division TA06 bacterium]